jgi:hypothetical protein
MAWIVMIMYFSYTFLWKKMHVRTWPGWNLRFLSRARSKEFVLKNALPSVVATALEEFQVEVCVT